MAAWFALFQFLAAPILGNLSDRYGRKPILVVSLIAFATSYLGIALAPTLDWIIFWSALVGTFAATGAAAAAYVADTTPPYERARKLGLVSAASGCGMVLGPLLVGVLEHFGPTAPFLVASGLALLNSAYGALVLPESHIAENRRSFSLARANPLGTLLQIRRSSSTVRMLIALGLILSALLTISSTWGYFGIVKFGWSQSDIGASLSFYAILMIVCQGTLVKPLSNRFGILGTILFGITCEICSLVGFAFSTQSWMMLAFSAPSAIGCVTTALLASRLSEQTPANAQGELQGAISCTMSVIAILVPLLMTKIFSAFAEERSNFYFPGAPYLIAALLACVSLQVTVDAFRKCDLRN